MGGSPFRQAQVWLFIDMKETSRLWATALERSNKLGGDKFSRAMWHKVLIQARQHPIMIRNVYKIIMSKNNSYYIKQWMDYAGNKNVNIEMPKIIKINFDRGDIKNEILSHWKLISPNDYQEYINSSLSN